MNVFRAAEILKKELDGKIWFDSISVVHDFEWDRSPTILVFAHDPDDSYAKVVGERGAEGYPVHVMKRENFRRNTYAGVEGEYLQDGPIYSCGLPTREDDGAHGYQVPVISPDGTYGYQIHYVRDGVLRVKGMKDHKVFELQPEWRLA